jgi:hypothetical protein
MHGGAGAARAVARSILAEGRFHTAVPHPLQSLLRAIGQAVSAPINAIGRWLDGLGGGVPGGRPVVLLMIVLVLAVVGVLVGQTLAGRRVAAARASATAARGTAPESAAELERAADAAEREGQLALAVRLRFRAGLLRLAERGAIERPGATPSREVASALGSPEFELLASRFDEITYGGSGARAEDVQEARRRWAAVVRGEARAR